MTIEKVQIRNFKLLKDVNITFSTDPGKPLTLVRAENGSGKTSILYAMIWGFYGDKGLPQVAKDLRLASNSTRTNDSIKVSVAIVFKNKQGLEGLADSRKYRLTRTVDELYDSKKIIRKNEAFTITEFSNEGEKIVEGPEGFIEKIVPERLRDVFFTNGDDVQRFISGQVSQRQKLVHESIKSLLGLEKLQKSNKDFKKALRQIEEEISHVSSEELDSLREQRDREEDNLKTLRSKYGKKDESISNIKGSIETWKKELKKHSGDQNLDEINLQIDDAESDIEIFNEDKSRIVSEMADHVFGPDMSLRLSGVIIKEGYRKLVELADKQVIPGVSLGVLQDRLDIGTCICGEALEPDSKHRGNIEALIESQKETSEKSNQLTNVFHVARHELQKHENGQDITEERNQLKKRYVSTKDKIRGKVGTVHRLEDMRRGIDPKKVKEIEVQIDTYESKLHKARESLVSIGFEKKQKEELVGTMNKQLEEKFKAVKIASRQGEVRKVLNDLIKIIEGALNILESDYLGKVSKRMNELFMYIVGSDESYEGSVFSSVNIDEDYNIVINTGDGKTLDPDFELNGASQRALTVSFIWALMEISGTIAPRIIDTPLGMVAGGVKDRLTETITNVNEEAAIDFQVMLLLTRSEIRDIEDIIDKSMGKWQTLSCSSHYPKDLVNNWGVEEPESRTCECSHRESCIVCARHYDSKSDLLYRGNHG